VAAEREDPPVVAIVDDLEGHIVAAPELIDEPLVGESGEEPARSGEAQPASASEGGRFHDLIIDL
jgi:hypothetical protein